MPTPGRRGLTAAALAAFVALIFFAASAPAASLQIGQLAPSNIAAGGCNSCNYFQSTAVPASPSYIVPPGEWTLTSWGAEGGAAGSSVSLRIFRPTGKAGQFAVAAQSALETVGAGVAASFPGQIAVQPGDVLGLETGPGPLQNYPATGGGISGDVATSVQGEPMLGQTVGPGGEFTTGTDPERLLNIAATPTTPTHTLSLNVGNDGVVVDKSAGVECIGKTCSYRFDSGTALALEALPAPGYMFAGWSGGCSGTGICHLSLTSDVSAGASFIPAPLPPGLVLGRLKRNLSRGTALLSIVVPRAGSLSLTSHGARGVVRQLSAAATIVLPVKPTEKARRQLVANGRAKVTIAITFTPSGGAPYTVMRAVTLREKKR